MCYHLDDETQDPTQTKDLTSLLDPSGGTVPQVMGFQLSTPPPTLSDDTIEVNIKAACLDIIATPTLPGPSAAPNITLSTGQTLSGQLDSVTNRMAPIVAPSRYDAKNVLGRITHPMYTRSDVLKSWATFSGVTSMDKWDEATGNSQTDRVAPYGSRLKALGGQCSPLPLRWLSEKMASTRSEMPLPLLSAEATLDSLVNGAFNADYAHVGWRGEAPLLNRDFMKGAMGDYT